MPGDRGCIGERRDLVDDDPAAVRIRPGGIPGRAQPRVERARRAVLDRVDQLGEQFPFQFLGPGRALASHHVPPRDRLEQCALEPLLAGNHQVSRIAAQRAGAGGERRLLRGHADPADQLAGQVFQRGQRPLGPVELVRPYVQVEQLTQNLLKLGHRHGIIAERVSGRLSHHCLF